MPFKSELSHKKYFFIVGGIFLFFIVSRLLIITTSVESTYWGEELYRGTIANEILQGLKSSLWDYQADHYDGGSLVMGMLTVPFFKLFGANLLALKLTPILVTCGTFLLLACYLKKFWGKKAAILGCLLYTFCPPVLIKLGLVNIGSHPESPIFSIALLWLYSLLQTDSTLSISKFFLFGFVAGIGHWFSSIVSITTLTCLIALAATRPKSELKQYPIFLLGFTLGVTPWLSYNIHTEWKGISFLREAFSHNISTWNSLLDEIKTTAIKLATLVLKTIPFSFGFKPIGFVNGPWISLLAFFSYLFFWILGASTLTKTKFSIPSVNKYLLPIILFPIVYLFIYSISAYRAFIDPIPYFVAYKYFTPLLFFMVVIAAVVLSQMKRIKTILSVVIAFGILGYSQLIFRQSWSHPIQYPGYNYIELGAIWSRYKYPTFEEYPHFIHVVESYPEKLKPYFFWGYFDAVIFHHRNDSKESFLKRLDETPVPYQKYFTLIWGSHLSHLAQKNLPSITPILEKLDSQQKLYFLEGIAMGADVEFHEKLPENHLEQIRKLDLIEQRFFFVHIGNSFYSEAERKTNKNKWEHLLKVLPYLQPEERKWFFHGLGQGAAGTWLASGVRYKPYHTLVSLISREDLPSFYYGIGWALRQEMNTGWTRAYDWISTMQPMHRAWAEEGYRDAQTWFGLTL